MKEPDPYSYMRWHRLSEVVDSLGTVELEAAASCDGIPVLARWVRQDDGSFHVTALDGESQEWEAVTAAEEECVPLTPPVIWSDALEQDKARLDWLDKMNLRLNAHHGSDYGWNLILSHNVTRLFSGPHHAGFVGDLDLMDAAGGKIKVPGCREAIDRGMREVGAMGRRPV